MNTIPKLTYTLITAGALPFIFLAACFTFGINNLPLLGNLDKLLSSYGLIIVAFLAGIHWGQHLTINGKWQFNLSVASNIITVGLWISFLYVPFKILVLLIAGCFLILLFIDKQLYNNNIIHLSYFRVRYAVTSIVILSLVISSIYA